MKTKQRGAIAEFVFPVLFVIGVITFIYGMDKISCHSKWELSGYKTQWGPMSGCLIQMPNGHWLPADNIREIDPKDVQK